MRELGAAVFRIYAFCTLFASLIPSVIGNFSFYWLTPGEHRTTFLLGTFLSLALETFLLGLLFVYAAPLARRVLPDVDLPSVQIDVRLATRIALAIAGVVLIAQSASSLVALSVTLFESVSTNAKHLQATSYPQWQRPEWQAFGQVLVGVVFLLFSRRS